MAKGMLSADAKNPQMGLHNTKCLDPIYWCRLHEIWLSETDVSKKGCKERRTLDMIATRRCHNLERKDFQKWYSSLTLSRKR